MMPCGAWVCSAPANLSKPAASAPGSPGRTYPYGDGEWTDVRVHKVMVSYNAVGPATFHALRALPWATRT